MNEHIQNVGELGTNPGDPLPMREGHVSHGRFERVLCKFLAGTETVFQYKAIRLARLRWVFVTCCP